jgi:hypothetical protein
MPKLNLDKTSVARRQLGTALALFLDDLDPVSVHTLACGGSEVAEHLTGKAGAEPFSVHVQATFPDLKLKEIRRLQNQYWNAFKHATTRDGEDRSDQNLLARFTDEHNDHTLFIGWYDYMLPVGSMPVEAQAFQTWYFALHPDKLNASGDASEFDRLFPDLREMSRAEQKRALREAIKQARAVQRIMDDARTDRRPLILGGCTA